MWSTASPGCWSTCRLSSVSGLRWVLFLRHKAVQFCLNQKDTVSPKKMLSLLSKLNQTESSMLGLVEVLSGGRRLWALGELAAIEGGYTQDVRLKHSYPQVSFTSSVSAPKWVISKDPFYLKNIPFYSRSSHLVGILVVPDLWDDLCPPAEASAQDRHSEDALWGQKMELQASAVCSVGQTQVQLVCSLLRSSRTGGWESDTEE